MIERADIPLLAYAAYYTVVTAALWPPVTLALYVLRDIARWFQDPRKKDAPS